MSSHKASSRIENVNIQTHGKTLQHVRLKFHQIRNLNNFVFGKIVYSLCDNLSRQVVKIPLLTTGLRNENLSTFPIEIAYLSSQKMLFGLKLC